STHRAIWWSCSNRRRISATTVRHAGSAANRRLALAPRHLLLQNGGEAQEAGFVAETADEMHADRQAGFRPAQRQRERRLPRDVEREHVDGVGPLCAVAVEVGLGHVGMAERPR